jgi:hypothetical protein
MTCTSAGSAYCKPTRQSIAKVAESASGPFATYCAAAPALEELLRNWGQMKRQDRALLMFRALSYSNLTSFLLFLTLYNKAGTIRKLLSPEPIYEEFPDVVGWVKKIQALLNMQPSICTTIPSLFA